MAKSLAAGLPLSAVVGKAAIMDAPLPGGLGGTYGGNPLACAVGARGARRLRDRGAGGARARRSAIRSAARCCACRRGCRAIGDVRGLGAMLAIELVTDPATKAARCGARAAGHRRGARSRVAAAEVRAAQERRAPAAAADRVAGGGDVRRRDARSGRARRAGLRCTWMGDGPVCARHGRMRQRR